MKADEKGIELLKTLEGCKLVAYRCSANRLTIGYGHTSNAGAPIVTPGMKITLAEADRILRRDVAYFEAELAPLIKVGLTQSQWNAVVSFAFNVGIPAFKASTLLKKVNSMRFEEVPSEMMKWTKYHNPKTGALESLPGLVIRRRSETSMWRALEKHADEISDEDMRQPAVAPTPIRSVMQSKEATTSVATSVAGVLLVASEMKKQIEDAQGLIEAFKKAAHDPNFVIASMVVLAGIAIFYWRSKRMNEEETM